MPMIFTVNLTTVHSLQDRQPYNRTEGANFALTRSAWFPDFLRDNHNLKHGDQLTISGRQALYLLNNFTSGDFKFLDYVSGTA
jgi:hypothetical protein